MIDNTEKNYFDYATENTKLLHETIDTCTKWRDVYKDLSPRETLKSLVKNMIKIEMNDALTVSGGADHLYNIISEAMGDIINENKLTTSDIRQICKESIDECGFVDDYESRVDRLYHDAFDFIDLKRLKVNHDIISKRYNINDLFARLYAGERSKNGFLLPFIFAMCNKLDTYNLELPEKIDLMCEEIAYVMYNKFKYMNQYNDDVFSKAISDIVPGVFTYVLGTYSADGIPEETINKVLDASKSKILSSSIFKINKITGTNKNYLDYITNADAVISSQSYSMLVLLSKYQRTGAINTKHGFLELMQTIKYDRRFDSKCLPYILWYIIYFYGIVTNKIEEFNISISRMLSAIIEDKVKYSDDMSYGERYGVYADYIHDFINVLTPDVLYLKDESDEFCNRYKKVIDELEKLYKSLKLRQDYFNTKDKEEIVADRHDDTGLSLPGHPSSYEIKNMVTFDFLKDKIDHLGMKESNEFIDVITDKCIISNQEATDYISKVLDVCPDYFDRKYLKTRLESVYKEISESSDYQDYTKSITAMGNVSNLISKINKIDNTPDVLKEDSEIMECAMDNINCTIDDIVSNNIVPFAISETTKDVLALSPVHELGILNYAKLALDKLKHGFDKLNDTQKSLFNTIDQLAETFDHFNEKEAKAEARLQVVKGKMLPSASSCLKTLLQAGALFIINPWFGLILIIVKYVTSKNATKEERQAVVDELEVEIEMIDRRIQDAVDDKDYKQERKLRVLKKKMLTQYSKLSYDNQTKWDKSLTMKDQTDETGSRITLKD